MKKLFITLTLAIGLSAHADTLWLTNNTGEEGPFWLTDGADGGTEAIVLGNGMAAHWNFNFGEMQFLYGELYDKSFALPVTSGEWTLNLTDWNLTTQPYQPVAVPEPQTGFFLAVCGLVLLLGASRLESASPGKLAVIPRKYENRLS